MSPEIAFRHDGIILDACCVINLHVSGHIESILRAVPPQVAVAAYVVEEEIQRYDLQPLIETGLWLLVEPETEEEAINVVSFAALLRGDGEAYTGAIATGRNWAIATDERRVLNFFAQRAPRLQRLTTPELLKFWADTTLPDAGILRQALAAITIEGSYISEQHPCHAWWQANYRNQP